MNVTTTPTAITTAGVVGAKTAPAARATPAVRDAVGADRDTGVAKAAPQAGGSAVVSAAPVASPAVPPTKEAAEAVIAEARGRIDLLDTEILEAMRRRMAVSAEVQAARIAVGGPRLSLTREMEILDRYRAQLGGHGTEIAMLLLELCRGRV